MTGHAAGLSAVPPSGRAATTDSSRAGLAKALILGGCAIGFGVNLATLFSTSFSVFIGPIAADTGWGRGAIALGLSAVTLMQFIGLPLVGRLIDHFGPRRVILASVPLLSIALGSFAWLPLSYPYFIGACLAIGLAGVGTYVNSFFAILSQHFHRRLGMMVGLAAAGGGLGQILSPIVSQALIEATGWRYAYLGLAFLNLLVLMPVAYFLPRDRPRPDRATLANSRAAGLRSPRLHFLVGAYFCVGLTVTGTISQVVPMLTDRGFSAGAAALYISYFGMAALVARFASGVLLDYLDAGRLGAASLLLVAAGTAILAISQAPAMTVLAVILIGTAMGTEGDILPYIVRRVFGLEAYASLIGIASGAFIAGSMLGPALSGLLYDHLASYRVPLLGFSVIAIAGAIIHARVTQDLPQTDGAAST